MHLGPKAASWALAGALLLVSTFAMGDTVQVKLTGAQETPPVTTKATGTGTIMIGSDKKVSGSIKTTGIEGLAAHIHLAPPGKSGPPIISLNKGADGTWSVPEGAVLTDEQYASYKAGELYVNVHTAENKAGEIRGQLKPAK